MQRAPQPCPFFCLRSVRHWVLPVCVLPVSSRIGGSVAVAIGGLFALGVVTSLFNARSALFSGARQVVIGVGAAAITYLVGRVFAALTGAEV